MGFGLVTGLLSMGSQVAAGEAGRASTVEGAKSQAAIEEKSRAYALQMFEEDIEQQRPFYEAGQAAGVQYGAAVANRLDPTTSGAYQLQKGLIDEDLKDAPSYVSAGAYSQLGAVEGEKQKSRLVSSIGRLFEELKQAGLIVGYDHRNNSHGNVYFSFEIHKRKAKSKN
jgi:hypothetical protein